MWRRKELKRQGKKLFFRNWLTIVSVCFLLAFTGAEFADSVSFIHDFDLDNMRSDSEVVVQSVNLSNWDIFLQWLEIDPEDGTHPLWLAVDQNIKPYFDGLTQPFSAFFAFLYRSEFVGWTGLTLAILGVVISLWFMIWVASVLTVGARRFFLECRVRDNISLRAVWSPFGRGRWWNTTKGILLKNVYLLLWALTIVGFPIKFYSYRMTPYLLAENPNLSPKEAITLSRRMMQGQKWRCFLVDLTLFLQWTLLPLLLLSIGSVAATLAIGNSELVAALSSCLFCLLKLFFLNGYRVGIYTQLYVILRQSQLEQDPETKEFFCIPEFGEAFLDGPKEKKQKAPEQAIQDPVFHYAYQHKLDYNRHYGIQHLILLFFAFAFVGWAWEVTLHIVKEGIFVNRGTMYGPWLPIYGVGGALALVLLKRLFKHPPLTFVVSMVLCSIIEYFASWYLEFTHGIRWWDYSGYFMNLNGRICLEGAVVFGLGCCVVAYLAGPMLAKGIDKMPVGYRLTLCGVLLSLFAVDAAYAHFHPNAGKGITDYDNWKQTSALPIPQKELPASLDAVSHELR